MTGVTFSKVMTAETHPILQWFSDHLPPPMPSDAAVIQAQSCGTMGAQ